MTDEPVRVNHIDLINAHVIWLSKYKGKLDWADFINENNPKYLEFCDCWELNAKAANRINILLSPHCDIILKVIEARE